MTHPALILLKRISWVGTRMEGERKIDDRSIGNEGSMNRPSWDLPSRQCLMENFEEPVKEK